MTRQICRGLVFPLLLWAWGASGQESGQPPARDFQLFLPDFFTTPFEGGVAVLDLPDRPLQRLQILMLDAAKKNISSTGFNVWVNGKGMSNILDARSVEQGLMLTMDPATLHRRPDELFDPRENTIEVLATDKRGRRYYESWILRVGGSQNAYFGYRGEVAPDNPQDVPPDLILEQPVAPIVLTAAQASASVMLKGTCSSAHPSISVKVNGQAAMNIQNQSAPFELKVNVTRSMKEVVLEATDEKHNRRSVVIPVVVQQKTATAPRFAGTRYALIIGISQFGAAADAPPPVPSAAPEAKDLARQLEESAGFRHENIELITDEKATFARIRTGFYDFASKAKDDDLLVVYVAGHALHDPRPGKNDKMYLAPYGTQLSQIDSTALSFEDLGALMDRSVKCGHTFLIFDVAHPIAGDWRFPGLNLVNNHLLNLFSDQVGRGVMVSGSADQYSQIRIGTTSSSFAYWITRALAGDADLNQDRVVTAEESFNFIAAKVQEDTMGAQRPRYKLPAKNADIPLAEVAARAKP